MDKIYKRIIIKVSGESLSAKDGILDKDRLSSVASIAEEVVGMGVQVGIVVGAGNIWRGRLADSIGIEQSTGDYMGMLGTIMNALAIQSAIDHVSLNPYFTTDTAAALRSLEVGAQAILMAKNGIDGVYDCDPRTHKDAKFLPELSFREVVERKLDVMDLTSVAMLEGKGVTIHVFNAANPECYRQVLNGEKVGTIIK